MVVQTILQCKLSVKMEFLMVTTSKKVAAYIYHINQEMPDAAGGAAPQGTKANWEK